MMIDVAARAERDAIVKYLRETAQKHKGLMVEKYPGAKHHFDACTWAALAIEEGDHHLPNEGAG